MRRVQATDVPSEARALTTLVRIDYEDAFLVEVDRAHERTPEEWARAVFEGIPLLLRLRLWGAWRTLGLRLASPASRRHVLGWEVRRASTEHVLLGARSLIGMPAELLLTRYADSILFDTFVQHGNPLARAVWAATEPTHRRFLPALLRQSAVSRSARPRG